MTMKTHPQKTQQTARPAPAQRRTACPPHQWEHHSSDSISVTFRCTRCGLFFRETKG